METNTYSDQQPQYYQTVDPNYSTTVKGFLTKAIVSGAISSLPVGSIIAIVMADKNRKAILDYIANRGPHTTRIKICSCLSRAAKYSGIGFSILWGIYAVYLTIALIVIIVAAIAATV